MRPEHQVVQATDAHALQLTPRMRAADVAECRASYGEPLEVLRKSLAGAVESHALLISGDVAAIWGYTLEPRGAGTLAYAWLLTGDLVDRHPVLFYRLSRAEVARALRRWSALKNWIDRRYARALEWARRLGADVYDAVPFGVEGRFFHPVVFRRR